MDGLYNNLNLHYCFFEAILFNGLWLLLWWCYGFLWAFSSPRGFCLRFSDFIFKKPEVENIFKVNFCG